MLLQFKPLLMASDYKEFSFITGKFSWTLIDFQSFKTFDYWQGEWESALYENELNNGLTGHGNYKEPESEQILVWYGA